MTQANSFPFGTLAGKTALVTGASAGLGRHFALTLARAGARVAVGARRLDRLAQVAGDITAAGGKAVAVKLDVTDPESIRTALAEAETTLGPVDILVNNAAITVDKSFLDHDESDFDVVADTGLKGTWLMAQAVARRLVALEQGGSIINIGSIYGHRVVQHAASYCAAKAGVIHLTRALALELARYDIRVNVLSPGLFRTEMTDHMFASGFADAMIRRTPQRRAGKLEDLDGPLLLLASESAGFMTGSVVTVDGGILQNSI